jgi:hypothetical protein
VLDPEKSLYHRLGGYDAIAAAIDDLLRRLTSDPQIGVYWKGKCTDSMKKDSWSIFRVRQPADPPIMLAGT